MKDQESMRIAVLLFSDLVGSVALQGRVGTQAYSRMLARHNELFRQAVETEGRGQILNYTGDGFLAELPSPTDAVNAALRFQWLVNHEPWGPDRLVARTALHLGEIAEIGQVGSGEVRHVGMAINHVARLMDLAQGSQILLSRPIWDDARRNVRAHPPVPDASRAPELVWLAHGRYLLKGTDEPLETFEVGARGTAALCQPADSAKAVRVADLTGQSTIYSERDQRTARQRLVRPNVVERRTAVIGACVVAVIGAALLLAGPLDGLSYDLAYLFRRKATPPEVVVVEMDSASTVQLNQPSDDKWDRRLHAQMLTHLAAAGAKAVAFDIAFAGESKNSAEDDALRAALQQTKIGVLGAAAETTTFGDNSISIIAPLESFRKAAAGWGVVERARSGRSLRRPFGSVGEFPAINEVLARLVTTTERKAPPGAWLNFYGPPGTIAHRSFASVLANEVPDAAFSNKVVFVGANTAIGYSAKPGTDYFLSPYTRWTGKEVPGVEVNATSYANLVRGDWLRRLPPLVELLLILAFGGVAGYALVLLQPMQTLIFGTAAAVAFAFVLIVQVWMTHLWFPWMIVSAVQLPIALVASFALRTRLATVAAPSRTGTITAPTGAKEGPSPSPAPGTNRPVIPDHEALRCIGHGAYGEVWLARDAIGSFHAVKIVRRAAFKEEGPFEREFKGLQRYTPLSRSHPGLVHILHVGRNDGGQYFYYIMEAGDDQKTAAVINAETYVSRTLGTDIGTLGRIPLARLVDHGIHVAEALAFLHRSGLIHRDIKPANIIFVNGKPKLADIGLVTEIAAPGQEISLIGTHGYIPPEGPGQPSADVFSLGKLLYVAVTGYPVKRFPEVPVGIEPRDAENVHGFMQILMRACEPITQERYQNAEEMLVDLKQFAQKVLQK